MGTPPGGKPSRWRGLYGERDARLAIEATSDSIRQLLAQPLIALLFGSLSGIGLAAISRLGIRYFTPENEILGPVLVAITTFGGMVAAIGVMYGYRVVAKGAFAWFGISLVAAFLFAVVVEVVRSGVLKDPGEGGS